MQATAGKAQNKAEMPQARREKGRGDAHGDEPSMRQKGIGYPANKSGIETTSTE